jgi:hypothetical protein
VAPLPSPSSLLSDHGGEITQGEQHEFFSEPSGYEKTILCDLKGAWECLREAAVEHAGFEG